VGGGFWGFPVVCGVWREEMSLLAMNTKIVDILIQNSLSHCFPTPNMLYWKYGKRIRRGVTSDEL